jgi:hypothetical protein
MRNRLFLSGIISMALTFGMTVAGCDNGTTDIPQQIESIVIRTDPALNGTWVAEWGSVYTFNNGHFEYRSSSSSVPTEKGTFITNDDWITITPTHFWGAYLITQSPAVAAFFPSDEWYTRSQLRKAANDNAAIVSGLGLTIADVEALLSEAFWPYTRAYSISSHILIFTYDNGAYSIYSRENAAAIYGTWGGTIQGYSATVTIGISGWTLSVPGMDFTDNGTFSMNNSNTASLYSIKYDIDGGIAVIINSNTISITLNADTIAPGVYILTRQ